MIEKLKELLGSRKVILLILGIIYALLSVFHKHLGISLNPEAIVTSMAVICVYIFGEAKADMKRIKKGLGPGKKWKEPQFWLSLSGALLPFIGTFTGMIIPVENINAVLAFLLALIFKKKTGKMA